MTDKPTLIFLPGSLCNAELFAPQITALQDQYQCIVADLNLDDSIQAMATRVLDNAPEKFSLIGLSMGGIVAFEMLRQSQDRIEKLALLDTNHLADKAENEQARLAQLADAENKNLAWLRDLFESQFYPRYVAPCHLDSDLLKTCVGDMAIAGGFETLKNHWLALATRTDASDVLKNLSTDTLIAYGEHDQLCTPEIHKTMASLAEHAELHCIADAGHISTLEQPDAVNKLLIDFLSR